MQRATLGMFNFREKKKTVDRAPVQTWKLLHISSEPVFWRGEKISIIGSLLSRRFVAAPVWYRDRRFTEIKSSSRQEIFHSFFMCWTIRYHARLEEENFFVFRSHDFDISVHVSSRSAIQKGYSSVRPQTFIIRTPNFCQNPAIPSWSL